VRAGQGRYDLLHRLIKAGPGGGLGPALRSGSDTTGHREPAWSWASRRWGVLAVSGLRGAERVWGTARRQASRSTSDQFRPRTSPRRIPVMAPEQDRDFQVVASSR
jgi:hypothetical protein